MNWKTISGTPSAFPTRPVEVLPNAREFLEFCRARGVRCFILTSVDAKEFDIQCRELGMMEYFEAIHAGIRHKDAHIHTLLAQHGAACP